MGRLPRLECWDVLAKVGIARTRPALQDQSQPKGPQTPLNAFPSLSRPL